jgi:hypothetical protein
MPGRDPVFDATCQGSLLDRGVRLALDDKSPADRQESGVVCRGHQGILLWGRGGDMGTPGCEMEA